MTLGIEVSDKLFDSTDMIYLASHQLHNYQIIISQLELFTILEEYIHFFIPYKLFSQNNTTRLPSGFLST